MWKRKVKNIMQMLVFLPMQEDQVRFPGANIQDKK